MQSAKLRIGKGMRFDKRDWLPLLTSLLQGLIPGWLLPALVLSYYLLECTPKLYIITLSDCFIALDEGDIQLLKTYVSLTMLLILLNFF